MNVPHNRLTHGAPEADAVQRVVQSGFWSNGPEVAQLERDVCSVTGRRGAVAVGSGLASLRLALIGLGIGPGDEVIVPGYSCVALANAVLAVQAKPVLADVTPGSWTIDPASVEALRTPRTRAIIAVHTFGQPADVASLRQTGVPVIEDCAHGLKTAGMGRLGDVAMSSFYATKLIGAGEGGAVMTDREDVIDRIRRWRDYGDQAADGTRLNDKMTEMSAALARCQLERLDAMIVQRETIARYYLKQLAPLAEQGIIALPSAAGDRIWYRFAVEAVRGDAKHFIAALRLKGIGADSPVWDWRNAGAACAPLPVTDRAYRRIVSLPIYPTLDDAARAAVVEAVLDTCKASAA